MTVCLSWSGTSRPSPIRSNFAGTMTGYKKFFRYRRSQPNKRRTQRVQVALVAPGRGGKSGLASSRTRDKPAHGANQLTYPGAAGATPQRHGNEAGAPQTNGAQVTRLGKRRCAWCPGGRAVRRPIRNEWGVSVASDRQSESNAEMPEGAQEGLSGSAIFCGSRPGERYRAGHRSS